MNDAFKKSVIARVIKKIFRGVCPRFSKLSPEEINQEIRNLRYRFFVPHPALPDLPLEFTDSIHVPQEMQFAIDCLPLISKVLQTYPRDKEVTFLDYGPGYCAGTNLFATLFRSTKLWCKLNVDAMDIKGFRKDLINLDYPLVNLLIGDIKDVAPAKQWNIIYCSNVVEHLVDPTTLISNLVNHSDGWVIIYAPYQETNLTLGHVSTITENTFRQFNPELIEIKESLAWNGKQILALLKGKANKSGVEKGGMKKHYKRPQIVLNKNELVEVMTLMSNICKCTTIKTKHEIEAANFLIESFGLHHHNDLQKDWDTLKSLYYVLTTTNSSASILDAGGGIHSPVLNALSSFGYDSLYACDVVDVNYSQEKFSDKIKFSIQDIENTNYNDHFFHAVTCLSVIEHGVDHRKFFAEMNRITKDDGLLIITTDYWPEYVDCKGIHPYGPENPEMKIYQSYDMKELLQIAKEYGFELCAPLDLSAVEKAVRWNDVDREYTFIFIAFRKMLNKPLCTLINDLSCKEK